MKDEVKIRNGNGEGAREDRAHIGQKYIELCKFMHVKPVAAEQVAKLTNSEFYRLCDDTYNRQPLRKQRAYTEWLVPQQRRNPRSFKWFRVDLLRSYSAAPWYRRVWLYLTARFRYPKYLKRVHEAEAKKCTEKAKLEVVKK